MSNLVMIKGVVKYSHITRHTTEEELLRSQQARKSKFKDNPHSYVSLEHVQVIPSDPSGQLTPAELLVQQNEFYTKQATPGVYYYSPKNASKNLANVFVRDAQGIYQPVTNTRELKQGATVAVQLRQYEAFAKQHFNMDSIFVGSEQDFYTGAGDVANDFFAKAGFQIGGSPIVTKVPEANATPAPTQPEVQPTVQPVSEQPVAGFVPQGQVPPANYNAPLQGVEAPVTGPYNPQVQPSVAPAPQQTQMPTVDPLLSGEGINSGITYQ